jgi:hypothetical protein
MAEASGASRRAAPRELFKTARKIASRMAAAGGASTWAAPRGLLEAAHSINCQAHGGGRRCQKEGCSKHVAKAPGSVYCRLCLQSEQPEEVENRVYYLDRIDAMPVGDPLRMSIPPD